MATPSFLDRAAGFATCQLLTAAGTSLVGVGVATLAAGGGGLVPLSLGTLSLLGAGAACQDTPVDGPAIPPYRDGCQKASDGGYGVLEVYWLDQWRPQNTGSATEAGFANEIVNVEIIGGPGSYISKCTFLAYGTVTYESFSPPFPTLDIASTVKWRINITNGTCADTFKPVNPYPPEAVQPITYNDTETNCTYNVTFQGFAADVLGGEASPVWKIEGAAGVRAGGGVVGGCNFEPVIYQQPPGGGGPPRVVPWDPNWQPWGGDDGEPPWKGPLTTIVGGVAGALTKQVLEELTKVKYPAGNREIYAACNYKQDGSPETFSVNFPEENYQDRVLTSLNAIVDFQQQILLWKTPTCSAAPAPLTGDPVSINWVSDEYSPFGNDRIRKLLTYFDQKNTSLAETVAHWKDFTWDAGPVIVSCVGTPLGRPQVWAVSVDEAKRVINHAAAIAGADMTNAEWLVAPPKSARYGVQGKMRVHRSADGVLGITKRDGPSGSPEGLV